MWHNCQSNIFLKVPSKPQDYEKDYVRASGDELYIRSFVKDRDHNVGLSVTTQEMLKN